MGEAPRGNVPGVCCDTDLRSQSVELSRRVSARFRIASLRTGVISFSLFHMLSVLASGGVLHYVGQLLVWSLLFQTLCHCWETVTYLSVTRVGVGICAYLALVRFTSCFLLIFVILTLLD